jgi:putative acyl-CoA dehydrogenase
VSKYWVCKSATWHVGEALECLGGNGYVELSGMPRLYREAPLNSIWEGSGNVNCLDVLRGMVRSPDSVDAFFAEVDSAGGQVAEYAQGIKDELTTLDDIEYRARRIVESMAVALQASLLVRHGDPAVADAFCATRLAGDRGRALGTLPRGVDCQRIVERHRPRLPA